MGRPVKRKPESGGGSNWLCTFNDLVTLLMVFFVLIFTMSSGDSDKMEIMKKSILRGLGLLESVGTGSTGLVKNPEPGRRLAAWDEKPSEVSEEVKDYIADMNSAMPWIKASISESGLTISLQGSVVFDPGIAIIHPRVFPALEGIGKLMNKIPNDIRVEGHSDNVPIATSKFPSNWELSIARAVNVTKYLIEHAKVSPLRLSAAGYGDSMPLHSNDTAENREKNRRVDIVLLKEDKK